MSALNELPLKKIDNSAAGPALEAAPAATRAAIQAAILRRRLIVNGLRIGFVAAILIGWEVFARQGVIDSFFWGQPTGIWAQLKTWVLEGTAQGPLWEQIAVTLEETVLGFLVGATLGIVVGIMLARVRFLGDVFGPFINIANAIPRVVLGPLFIVSMGLGLQSKVMLAVVMVFFAVFYNVFQGVREVDRNLVANARILGASSWQISRHVIFPSAMTWIIASLHISFGLALVGAVVSEFLGSLKGLGLMIATAQGTFNPNGLFAAILILAIVTLIVEGLITRLEKILLRWRPSTIREVGL